MAAEAPSLEPILAIEFKRTSRTGSGTLTAKCGGEFIHVNTLNITKEADRNGVVKELTKDRPGIDAEDLKSQLLELAGREMEGPPRDEGAGPSLASDPDTLYPVLGGCICRTFRTQSGEFDHIPLCNFDARITEEVVLDDGVEQSRRLTLEGTLASGWALPAVEVSMEEFGRGDWPLIRWGSQAVVHAGQGIKDHLRAAIQLRSECVQERVVRTFTGWCRIGEEWAYLHAGGAIGPTGPVEGISVQLPDALVNYALPDPPSGDSRITAVRASLDLATGLASDEIILPLLATTYRSVLPGATFSTHVSGRTGSGKTELAALMQQHSGPRMSATSLPANWSSTGNALEAIAFAAKDALLVVDDFCPTGSQADVARFHKDADRLFRAQGNRSGRQRLRPDGSTKQARPPRGMILSTGEDVPRGHSLRARLLVVEVGAGDVDFDRLTECQRDAASGVYAQALAAYLRWLSPQYEQVSARLKSEVERLRDAIGNGLGDGRHPRTPTVVAELLAGFDLFLSFAQEVGAITHDQIIALRERCRRALLNLAAEQASHQGSSDPCSRYLELLASALSSGRAYVAGMSGDCPGESPQTWGWRSVDSTIGNPRGWEPLGRCIGWLDGENLYLDPGAAFAEIQRLAGDQGEPLTVGQSTLHKRLNERQILASVDSRPGHLTVRRTIAGSRRSVLHLRAGQVLGVDSGGPTDPTGPDDEESRENGPQDRAVSEPAPEKRPRRTAPKPRETLPLGPIGPIGTPAAGNNRARKAAHEGREEVIEV
jgi:hypothetical protein